MFDLEIKNADNTLYCHYGDFTFNCKYSIVDGNYQAGYIYINIVLIRDCDYTVFDNSLPYVVFFNWESFIDSFKNKITEYLENYINYWERTPEQTQVVCRTLFLALKDLNKKCQEVIANQ